MRNMNSRIDTLLEKFNLEERRFNNKISQNDLEVNYKEAYKILEEERKKVVEFLLNALELKEG